MRPNGNYETVEKKSFNKYYSNNKNAEEEKKNGSSNGFYRKNSKLKTSVENLNK